MKYFIEHANGRTLFFIDELGSGSDPSLGGSFAEVILEELSKKHAFGIVTTHYLNLKVMANHTAGLVNAAMAFDERHLQPLYRLITGKPGSSYTFAIAERIGLPKQLINRARNLVDEGHFRLDKLLDRTEQDRQWLDKEKKELQKLLQENNRLQREMEIIMGKERHRQQLELLKHRNKITEERIANMKETERKLKQIVLEWKKTENKDEVMKQIQHLLFRNKDEVVTSKLSKKIEAKYQEVNGIITVGAKVKMKKNPQVGIVKEIRGKRALVQIGLLPMSVELKELIMVEEKHKTAT
jgi:DNA mismatch repair protein MutS2